MDEFKKNQHICMAFRWCSKCGLKWCNICRKCRCGDVCPCGKIDELTRCEKCFIRKCNGCVKTEYFRNILVGVCFDCIKKECTRCMQISCRCKECEYCGKITNGRCIKCHGVNVCKGCARQKNMCSTCADVDTYCGSSVVCFRVHRCENCYNVFIDPRPQIRKSLIAAIIGLRKLPKPIVLMILARSAEYIGEPIRSYVVKDIFEFGGLFDGDEHNIYN